LSIKYYESFTFIHAFKSLEGSDVKSEELSILKMGHILRMCEGTEEPNIAVGLVYAMNYFIL
jgi:hypothetical protein